METKELLSKIPQDKMYLLGDIYSDMLHHMKEHHPEMYSKYYMETYALAYGYELNEELAKMKVHEMKPLGEYWTMDQTTTVGTQNGIDFTKVKKCTWYYVMNMLRNDYANILGNDVNTYVKMAKAWLEDIDSPYSGDEKTFRYIMM